MVTNRSFAEDADPARHDPTVANLVARARRGDEQAWNALVKRYAPLIWSICRRHRLTGLRPSPTSGADDVGQAVWLQLLDHLDNIRDPAVLAGWLASTARRECGRVLRAAKGPQGAKYALDAETIPDEQTRTAEQELLAAERHAMLREAVTRLPSCCQQLIALLIEDPPVPDAQISAKLGIPVGRIGPNRRLCLEKLRRDPAIAALINPDAASTRSELSRQAAVRR